MAELKATKAAEEAQRALEEARRAKDAIEKRRLAEAQKKAQQAALHQARPKSRGSGAAAASSSLAKDCC